MTPALLAFEADDRPHAVVRRVLVVSHAQIQSAHGVHDGEGLLQCRVANRPRCDGDGVADEHERCDQEPVGQRRGQQHHEQRTEEQRQRPQHTARQRREPQRQAAEQGHPGVAGAHQRDGASTKARRNVVKSVSVRIVKLKNTHEG